MVCTFKDIDDYLKPEKSIDLSIGFIFFEAQKDAAQATYELKIFVAETFEDPNFDKPYFTTKLNVLIPEPFLEINPLNLVMPTVSLNTWSRASFSIENHGFKEIFVKIKKPINITFDFEYQIVDPEENKGTINRKSEKRNHDYLENQLTKLRNSIMVKISFRSKTKVSFNTTLVIEDNFGKKYDLVVAGTCTDSPFFSIDSPSITAPISSQNIVSSDGIPSSNNFSSSSLENERKGPIKSGKTLSSTDIEDLLFINNWLGNMISEISNESTFFYVWLTKP